MSTRSKDCIEDWGHVSDRDSLRVRDLFFHKKLKSILSIILKILSLTARERVVYVSLEMPSAFVINTFPLKDKSLLWLNLTNDLTFSSFYQ